MKTLLPSTSKSQFAAAFFFGLLSASVSAQCSGDNRDSPRPCFIAGLPTNVTYRVGDSAELLCGVQEVGSRTVYWWKDGDDHPLTINLHHFISSRRISVQHKSGVYWNLKIDRVTLRDAGTYICKVSTSPAMQRAVALHVIKFTNSSTAYYHEYDVFNEYQQSAPIANVNSNTNVNSNAGANNVDATNRVMEGTAVNGEAISVMITNKTPGPHFVDDRLFLECSVAAFSAFNKSRTHSGSLMCDIEWFHDNNAVHSDRRKDILITLPPSTAACKTVHTMSSTLLISKLKTKHSGTYSCNFKVIPPRDNTVLRSDTSNSFVFQKESGLINVHVRVRNASVSVTAQLHSNSAGTLRLAQQFTLLYLLIFITTTLCANTV